jgi:hypothetical protein
VDRRASRFSTEAHLAERPMSAPVAAPAAAPPPDIIFAPPPDSVEDGPAIESDLPPAATPAPAEFSAAAPTSGDRAAAAASNKPLAAPADPLAVREPTTKKIVTSTGQVKELRVLSPEEKAARRFRRNMLLLTFGLVILGIVTAVLMHFG